MRRSISSILGTPAEDSLPATFTIKPLPSSSTEEIKHLRSNLREGSVKARDRVKAFGGNASKMSPQSHLAAISLELGYLKSEERAKSAVPNRRMRTSLVEVRMDARFNSSARQSGTMDKERDMLKLVNGGATPSKEKVRGLPTVVDGWEKSKMNKRSAIKPDASGSAVLARSYDSDREPKRGMQQKLATDARPRLTNTHGFSISDSKFTQQELPACKPILTPQWVIPVFTLIGTIFIPIGVASLFASKNVLKDMDKPIYVYYELDNFYQNHRRCGMLQKQTR